MDILDLTKNGGLKFTQQILDFMQTSYTDVFLALGKSFGDKVIINGCNVAAGVVSDGWLLVDGEPIKFTSSTLDTKVAINTATQVVRFRNGIDYPIKKYITATCAPVGAFDFSQLKRLDKLVDAQQSIANLATALASLTNSFNNHTHSWNDIANKPIGAFATYKGSHNVGDALQFDTTVTINIPPQTNANYVVAGSMVGGNANLDIDNDISWIVSAKTATSFKLGIREYTPSAQNLTFEFVIFN
jgi:hypothetical protein